jgi:hypothetical protein
MEFDSLLLAFRAVIYFATFLIIASFRAGDCRWRPGVSLFAVGLAGSSLALSVLIVTDWASSVGNGLQWMPTMYCLCVFALVARCRGNLAKLLPRFKCRTHA